MENMNTEHTQAQNMGDDTGAQDNSGGQKMFTQDEVNSLIQARLARVKEQAGKDAKAEYDQKMGELQARELKLAMKEKLDAREMPRELADVLACTSEEDIDKKLDALQKIYGDGPKKIVKGFQIGAPASPETGTGPRLDAIRNAMGLNR